MDTVHECDRQTDGQTDGQNFDHKDRATHSVARYKSSSKHKKWFSVKKIKHLLRFLYLMVPMDYETHERVPWERTKMYGLDNLITKLLKKWMTKRNA